MIQAKSDHYPVGAVIMFGGTLPINENWLLCDGQQLDVSQFPELFEVIKYSYGGEGNIFSIPNYLGQFLRGASQTASTDPDKKHRQSLDPKQANSPEGVGTLQQYATALPKRAPFQATFSHLPNDYKGSHGETKKNNTGGVSTINQATCTSGGDKESRPVNVYVNMYIKSRST